MGAVDWPKKAPPKKVTGGGGDWSRLPKNIVNMITEKLEDSIVDHIRFGAVCSSWRLVAAAADRCRRRRDACSSKTPWLLFPITPIEKTWKDSYKRPDKKTRFGLLNVSQQKIYNLDLPDDIRNTFFCVAAYKSWLLLSYEDDTCFLLNPFTSAKVRLPPKNNICILSISKFVLSEESESEAEADGGGLEQLFDATNFTVMAMHGTKGKLAYCRPGDESWTLIDNDYIGNIDDLMYYQGYFYTLDELGGVVAIDLGVEGLSSSSVSVELIKARDQVEADSWSTEWKKQNERNYIVGSSDDKLLFIKRRLDKHQTFGFEVSELDASCKDWVRVRRLPDNSSFFVGHNFSVSIISPSESKNSSKCCRPNCIYFVDHYKKFPVVFHDVAAFDLRDASIQHLAYAQGVLDIGMNFLQGDAVWITPSLS